MSNIKLTTDDGFIIEAHTEWEVMKSSDVDDSVTLTKEQIDLIFIFILDNWIKWKKN